MIDTGFLKRNEKAQISYEYKLITDQEGNEIVFQGETIGQKPAGLVRAVYEEGFIYEGSMDSGGTRTGWLV